MNKNVNPVVAFFIILIAIVILGFKFWARGEALQVRGPDQMQFDAQGNLNISIKDTLYKLSPERSLLAEYNLQDFGVYDMVGDFAFFSNGDILIRKGGYDPGIFESVLMFLRISSLAENPPADVSQGLYRCNLQTQDCSLFGKQLPALNSAFHLAIDWSTDEVYLAHTPQHAVYKYSADGSLLAEKRQGYVFPNQISLINNQLYIADTNNHRIQLASAENNQFADIIQSYRVTGDNPTSNNWVYSFVQVGQGWWINNMNSSMRYGQVAVFDDKWNFVHQLPLPENADPIDMARLGDYVLISDLENIDIHIYDLAGQPVEVELPATILNRLTLLQESKGYYRNLELTANTLLFVFLFVGILVAYLQARLQADPSLVDKGRFDNSNINLADVQWVKRNTRRITLIWVAYGIIFFMFLISAIGLWLIGPMPEMTKMLAFIIIVMSLLYYILRRQMSMKIGYLNDAIVIMTGSKKYFVGRADGIYYSDNYILIDQVYIPFNMRNSLFHTEDMVLEIMPRLKHANYVPPGVMTNMIIKRMSKLMVMLTICGLALVFLVMFSWMK